MSVVFEAFIVVATTTRQCFSIPLMSMIVYLFHDVQFTTGDYPRHDLWQVKELLDNCKTLFPGTSYAIGSVVGIGQQGLVLTSLNEVSTTISMITKGILSCHLDTSVFVA